MYFLYDVCNIRKKRIKLKINRIFKNKNWYYNIYEFWLILNRKRKGGINNEIMGYIVFLYIGIYYLVFKVFYVIKWILCEFF